MSIVIKDDTFCDTDIKPVLVAWHYMCQSKQPIRDPWAQAHQRLTMSLKGFDVG